MKRFLMILALVTFLSYGLFAQAGKDVTVFIDVIFNENGSVTLKWEEDDFEGSYQIYKGSSLEIQDYNNITVLESDATEWTDNNYEKGSATEYLVFKVNSQNQGVGFGFVYAGQEVETNPSPGKVILLIDSTYINPLETEFNILEDDLHAESWLTERIYAGRDESPKDVRNKIVQLFNNSEIKPTTLYIIGHVPVPYSGYYTTDNVQYYPPDGHADHTGAWPADVYYGVINTTTDVWTDNSVNYTDGSKERLNNVPGDGKFDQTVIPDKVDLEVGRVDFHNLPAFEESDTTLLRNYLNRVHQWRTGELETVNRGLIDDNFKGNIISNTGYETLHNLVGKDSLFDDNSDTGIDYFPELKDKEYLWSVGAGAGSYTSCKNVGKTSDFADIKVNTIFTSLGGSYFGDWDTKNNLLRASIASGALVSFWGGIPKWYTHFMALGKTIGMCTKFTQNATIGSFNNSQNKVHIALMGDPTLKLSHLNATMESESLNLSQQGNSIMLEWQGATGEFKGYNVYRYNNFSKKYIKLNESIIDGNSFIDENPSSGNLKYALRTVKLEETPTGSYYNLGMGSYGEINYAPNSVAYSQNDDFYVSPNPSSGTFKINYPDNISNIENIGIYDLTGRLLENLSTDIVTSNNKIIKSDLQNGVYILVIESDEKRISEKIQIIR